MNAAFSKKESSSAHNAAPLSTSEYCQMQKESDSACTLMNLSINPCSQRQKESGPMHDPATLSKGIACTNTASLVPLEEGENAED